MAGGLTNTKLKVNIREYDETFPASRRPDYFRHKKTKQEPRTYGEAVENRISKQHPKWRKQNPYGGNISGVHKNSVPFEP